MGPYSNQYQDAKPQSGTPRVLQSHKSGLKGHECSLHLQNQDRDPKFITWVYQRPVQPYSTNTNTTELHPSQSQLNSNQPNPSQINPTYPNSNQINSTYLTQPNSTYLNSNQLNLTQPNQSLSIPTQNA